MYDVRYTESARQDLEEIFSYIANDSLENALSFLDELKEHFDNTLSVFPNGGALHNKAKGIRKHSHKGYTAFYHVPSDSTVEILHIVHLRQPLSVRGINF